MYLPTGTPHAARAQDTVSLHITIGINQLTWRGLVERSLSSLAAEVPTDHLPAGYLEDPQALAHQLGRHLSDIADRLRARRPRRRGARTRCAGSSPRGRRAWRARWSTGWPSTAIDDDTLLRRRPGHPCVLVEQGDRLEVLLGRPHPRRTGLARPGPRARSGTAPSCGPATCRSTSRAGWCCPDGWSGKGCSGSSLNDERP